MRVTSKKAAPKSAKPTPTKLAAKPAEKVPAKAAPKGPAKSATDAKPKAALKPAVPARPPAKGAKPKLDPDIEAIPTLPPAAPAPEPEGLPEHGGGREALCLIEIVKDGHFFIARSETRAGTKEYKNTVFEDMLTEVVITVQEQIGDR